MRRGIDCGRSAGDDDGVALLGRNDPVEYGEWECSDAVYSYATKMHPFNDLIDLACSCLAASYFKVCALVVTPGFGNQDGPFSVLVLCLSSSFSHAFSSGFASNRFGTVFPCSPLFDMSPPALTCRSWKLLPFGFRRRHCVGFAIRDATLLCSTCF